MLVRNSIFFVFPFFTFSQQNIVRLVVAAFHFWSDPVLKIYMCISYRFTVLYARTLVKRAAYFFPHLSISITHFVSLCGGGGNVIQDALRHKQASSSATIKEKASLPPEEIQRKSEDRSGE